MGRLLPGSQQWQEDSDSSRGTVVTTKHNSFSDKLLFLCFILDIYFLFCAFHRLKCHVELENTYLTTSENFINEYWLFLIQKRCVTYSQIQVYFNKRSFSQKMIK